MLTPMLAMVFLIFIILLFTFVVRVRRVRGGKVSMLYFKTYQGVLDDELLIATSRHFSNLFEVPVLFFAACLTCMVIGYETQQVIILAWLYVIFRAGHALIHLTTNNVMHRLLAFMGSNVCLLLIWLMIALR